MVCISGCNNIVLEATQASSAASPAMAEASPMKATAKTTTEVSPAASGPSAPSVPAVERATVAVEDAAAEAKPSVDERAAGIERLLKVVCALLCSLIRFL